MLLVHDYIAKVLGFFSPLKKLRYSLNWGPWLRLSQNVAWFYWYWYLNWR